MKTPFVVSDATEIIALHRALIEAKLPLLSDDQDLSASPIVAAMAERLNTSLGEAQPWFNESWRTLSSKHAAWEPAVARALSDQDYLRTASLPQKRDYVRFLLAPYRNDDETITRFLDHVESILRERKWYQLWLRKSSPFAGGVAFLMEEPDGRFTAWDANHVEIASGSLEEVGQVLCDGNFEPRGYFVHDMPETTPSSQAQRR